MRKSWEDAKSQIGAYGVLENAKKACDDAGANYKVYNSKGAVVYPKSSVSTFTTGDEVQLVKDAVYTSGKAIPNWVIQSKLYVREIYDNGQIVISTQKTGAVTGVVEANMLQPYNHTIIKVDNTFKPYLVKITAGILNVRAGAGTNYKIKTQVRKNEVYTIIAEDGNWGKLKSGAGWIFLDYTKKV